MVVLDYPVFLPGSSAKSGAGLSGMKKHSGNLADTPQTAAFAATWPSAVPPVYAVQTVWAQAALATLDRVDVFGARGRLNVGGLHAQTMAHNPQYRGLIVTSLRANSHGIVATTRLWADFVAGLVVEAAVRARGLLYRLARSGYYRYDYTRKSLENIQDAAEDLDRHLAETDRSFGRSVG
jgi:hypothetical protein